MCEILKRQQLQLDWEAERLLSIITALLSMGHLSCLIKVIKIC